MTQTYFTKTVIGPRNIVVTSIIMGVEHMTVVDRGLTEDRDLAAAVVQHKELADRAFGTSSEQQTQQRQSFNRQPATTLLADGA